MALKLLKEYLEDSSLDKNVISLSGDIPLAAVDIYVRNYLKLTKRTGKLLLFVGDQKIEYLNDAFSGKDIHEDDADPEHMFKIANSSVIGCFASQPGLIARYGHKYPNIPYLVKINSKTHKSKFGVGGMLGTIEQIVLMRKSGLNILGVGYTLYIGGEQEHILLEEAAQLVREAHKQGLVTVMWAINGREKDSSISDAHTLAGSAGVALTLGFDFVHLHDYVKDVSGKITAEKSFEEVIKASGIMQVSVRAGKINNMTSYLNRLHKQINIANIDGTGVGRAVHQKSFNEAVRTLNALASIIFANESVDVAKKVYETGKLSKGLKKLLAENTNYFN